MKRKTGFFGIGPWLALIAGFYFSQAAIISLDHIPFYHTVFVSRKVDENVGIVLFLAGLLVLLTAHAWFVPAWAQDRLATAGPYRLCRHPMYSALILLMLPGVGLMSHSWLIMANVLVAYLAFKLLIKREDRKLEAAFGQAYLDYRARTNEIVPWVRRGAKTGG